MPTKAEMYSQMADKVATQLVGSWKEWTAFLTTAARLYKYPFHEQMMIYAQRPDATACAEYDLWNEKMGRYVRRGSKGIALVDDSGDKPRLRYVFDISDTGTREHSRTPWLWQLEEQHIGPVSAMLERSYGVAGDDLAQQLTDVAGKLASEYWDEHQRDFRYIVDGSFLAEYDDYNIEVQFKSAATVSIAYALMSRCGLDTEQYFQHEDFMPIFDFNTPATVGALGAAVSQINQQVLRQIGVTIQNYEREQLAERSVTHGEQPDLHDERRLSDPRPEADRTAGEAPGQVRQDAESVPEGTPSPDLQSAAADREAVSAPHRDRRDSAEPSGADDAPTGGGSGRDGAAESQRPDALGGPDEHLQSTGRGDSDGGAYSQLSFFLSEAEQIRIIDEAENVKTSSAFSFAQEQSKPDPTVWEYNGVKERHPDDMVLYQMGDFFELYGEDAKTSAAELGLNLTTRTIPGGGRVEMCGFPANRLEQVVEQLRDKHDVTISAVPEGGRERQEYSMPSIDHEAEQHINAQEAEFGADGTRAFRETEAAAAPTIRELHEKYKPLVMEAVTQDIRYRNACGHSDYENAMIECNAAVRRAILDSHNIELIRLFSDVPEFRQRLHREVADETYPKLHELLRPLSDNDIDKSIQDWNGKIESKHAVVRYMEKHGREKDTAGWLAREFDGSDGKTPFSVRPESPEGTVLPWPKVQRRIAQLIKEDRFLTEQDRQSEPQNQEKRPYQVVVYHHLENGFDEKKEYSTLEEAEKAAQSYVDGTMEPDGFAYDGAAVYDLEARQYLRIYGDYPDEKAHEQLNELAHPHDLQAEVEAWEAEQAAQKQAVIDTLSEQEQLTVRAMETAGFIFNPQAANPGLKENLVFTAGEYGYPITFENWEQAYLWIDGAELRDTPGLREQVQHILHPEPQNGVLTNEDYAAARGTLRERTSYDPAVPPYHVGDTVYLDDRPHQITELRDNTVQLLPTGMSYPIYRAESRERFEQLLREDNRNDFYTEFLPVNLDTVDQDLRDVLAHGLIGEADKAELSELLRNGKSNREIALWLSRTYPNIVETMELETGETADYRTMPEGIELEVLDADEKRLAMLFFQWSEVAPLLRGMYARQLGGFEQEHPEPAAETPTFQAETVAVYPGDKNNLPYDVVVQTLRTNEPEPPTPDVEPEKTLDEVLDEHPVSIQVNGEWQTFPNVKAAEEASYEEYKANLRRTAENFRITDDHLGEGGPKAKFQANVEAIKLLKHLEETTGQATPEQQKILSRYVGWGGLADAFDPEKESWSKEYAQLKELLTSEEYAAARGSTLNAHYTSPTVIRAIYEAVGRMGFETGNILEPSCGVGNFFGMLPEEMRNSHLYGVELDSISGRIAQQLYPKANITVAGFETTDRRDFYDLAVGNVPFGQYQVRDKAYDKLNFSIHNYFFAKALDQVRPGGVVAFVTSRYTMDAKDSTVRRYLAQRAELLGAIRLPNNAFRANAGTDVVSDIIFLQKRDRPLDIAPDWTQTGQTEDGFAINRYFLDHPEMVLGRQEPESTAHGMDYTVNPIEGLELADQLHDAVKYIRGTYQEVELPELGEGEAIDTSIPADPNVKNYSYTVVDGDVYYRENSRMVRPDLNATAEARVKGLVGLRECVQQLIDLQMDAATPDSAIQDKQAELNRLYDSFSAKYGLINDRANRLAFADDSSYYLLCALEVIDEDGKLERKADMFTKRTIKPHKAVDTVDTASEALAVSISEKACVDMAYMSELTGKTGDELAAELQGVIFRVPGQVEKDGTPHYVTADEYLSGNVRRKLRQAQRAAQQDPSFAVNVEALTAAQPKDLDASEIEVRLGATWINKEYIQQFMYETFDTPFYLQRNIEVNYSSFHRRVADHRQKLGKPEQCSSLYHLRNQPCQCLQDSGGQPEPAGCPYLRHRGGRGWQGAPGAECQRDYPGCPKAAGHPGCFQRLDLEGPGASSIFGPSIQ